MVELPNRSSRPQNSFSVLGSDIKFILGEYRYPVTAEVLSQMTLWHSHPGGNIGPSRIDLQQRVQGISHLVISVTEDEIIPTWY